MEDNPIIAAVKSMDDLEGCCKLEDIRVVFVLFGDICSIGDIVKKIKAAGKIAMVHVDLIGGLSPREIAVDYLKNNTDADGIITTKPSVIKKAKELSLYTCTSLFPARFNGLREYSYTAAYCPSGFHRSPARSNAKSYSETLL